MFLHPDGNFSVMQMTTNPLELNGIIILINYLNSRGQNMYILTAIISCQSNLLWHYVNIIMWIRFIKLSYIVVKTCILFVHINSVHLFYIDTILPLWWEVPISAMFIFLVYKINNINVVLCNFFDPAILLHV